MTVDSKYYVEKK